MPSTSNSPEWVSPYATTTAARDKLESDPDWARHIYNGAYGRPPQVADANDIARHVEALDAVQDAADLVIASLRPPELPAPEYLLAETPTPVFGTPRTAWSNGYMAVQLVPTPNGDHVLCANPDGSPQDGAGVLVHDGARILLISQPRYAIGLYTWELPAGGVDQGEADQDAAARELYEETGLRVHPATLEALLRVRGDSARSAANCQMFYVRVDPSAVHSDGIEIDEARWVPVENVLASIQAGRIVDAATVASVLTARLRSFI